MPDEPLAISRDRRIRQIVDDVIDRRARGELITDVEILQGNKDLLTGLELELRKLRIICRGESRARELVELEAELSLPQRERSSFPGYEVLRQLGYGGQSRVMLARSIETEELVAIKVLIGLPGADQDRVLRLRREAEILHELRHPGIVTIIESGTSTTDNPFLVMPYIEGADLDPRELCLQLNDEQRIGLFLQICRAMQAAHAKNIIHRDLKPQNIRLDAAGQPHILDFGLASEVEREVVLHSITTTGEFTGTFMWSSPEQFTADGEVTTASDVYSLGVILHQLLCSGRFPPQVFNNLQRQVGTVSGRRSGRLSFELDTPLSRACSGVLAKSLDEVPARRYSNAGELAYAIERMILRSKIRMRIRNLSKIIGAMVLVAFIAGAAYLLGRSRPDLLNYPDVNGRHVLVLNGAAYNYCPPGRFIAGWRTHDSRVRPADEDQREIVIEKGFYLGMIEVTQTTYEQVMGVNPSVISGGQHPVESVSYGDAMEYCHRLSMLTGRVCRLPTEWEWEYACRAGTDTVFSFGDDPNLCIKHGNAVDLSNTSPTIGVRMQYNDQEPFVCNVTHFNCNAWRLFDMHGNVWEWCQAPYAIDPGDPATAIAGFAPLRGGSWFDLPTAASHRNQVKLETRENTVGFRVLVEESPADKE